MEWPGVYWNDDCDQARFRLWLAETKPDVLLVHSLKHFVVGLPSLHMRHLMQGR